MFWADARAFTVTTNFVSNRSSHLQMFFKIDALKNFALFRPVLVIIYLRWLLLPHWIYFLPHIPCTLYVLYYALYILNKVIKTNHWEVFISHKIRWKLAMLYIKPFRNDFLTQAEAAVNRCSSKEVFLKFRKFHRKTHVLESLFD